MKTLTCCLALLFLPALVNAAPVDLQWAGSLDSSSGGVSNPAEAVGAPDGVTAGFLSPSPSATYSGFGTGDITNTDSASLATLLGTSEAVLSSGDFIAFERNGSTGLNFETATWTFSDGTSSIIATVDILNPGATSEIVAFGQVSNAAYASFFGFANPYGNVGDYPFLVFDLDNLNLDTLTLSAVGTGVLSPDPDAFGVISNVPLPAAAWLFGSALFGLVAAKRRKG